METREVKLSTGSKVVLREGPFKQVRLGLIDGAKLLSLRSNEHFGIDVAPHELVLVRDALNDVIAEKL